MKTERLCDFEGDGKPGACLEPAPYSVKNKNHIFDLCKFHCGFIMSTDYQHEFKITRQPSGGPR